MNAKFSQKDKDRQRHNVVDLYDSLADRYDLDFEGKSDHQAPILLADAYRRHGIHDGVILDVGCGTGKLRDYLGPSFSYIGIDSSEKMLAKAVQRGFETKFGDAEREIANLTDKSVDHVVALSSLYFMEGWPELYKEFERVAKVSIFVTLEQFDERTVTEMKEKGIDLFNHSAGIAVLPTEIMSDVYLWKRPHTGEYIHGNIVFKLLSGSR